MSVLYFYDCTAAVAYAGAGTITHAFTRLALYAPLVLRSACDPDWALTGHVIKAELIAEGSVVGSGHG